MDEGSILHVVVGHGLPTLFLNTVRSFREVCPTSALLVIDNGSPQAGLRRALEERAAREPQTEARAARHERAGEREGGRAVRRLPAGLRLAAGEGFRYVHLLQGDMQCMWWDRDARAKLAELYHRHPACVNVHTRALSSDRTLMGDLVVDVLSGDATLPGYGMTDTGMVDLRRWEEHGMRFLRSEEETAALAAAKGLEVVVSPWPTEVPVPWPAVVRSGRQVGREVQAGKPLLCRPLGHADVAAIKAAAYPVAWEEMCVPWGWSCLAPMSETDLSNWYYLNYRRRAVQRHGWRAGRPRWVVRGLDRRRDLVTAPHRPSVMRLVLRPVPSVLRELARHVPWARRPARDSGSVPSGPVTATGPP